MSAVRRSSDRSPVRWGFHRLDDRTARYVVDRARICETDLVVDLGAGAGALTAALVRVGARVIAVELHPGRAAQLDRRFRANLYVTVVRADLRQVGLPREPYRVVANPPWKLADAVCDRLRRSPSLLRADLVVRYQGKIATNLTSQGSPESTWMGTRSANRCWLRSRRRTG